MMEQQAIIAALVNIKLSNLVILTDNRHTEVYHTLKLKWVTITLRSREYTIISTAKLQSVRCNFEQRVVYMFTP